MLHVYIIFRLNCHVFLSVWNKIEAFALYLWENSGSVFCFAVDAAFSTCAVGRMSLEGKLALVTGSTSGIGLAIVNLLAKHRCDVILTGLEEECDFLVSSMKT